MKLEIQTEDAKIIASTHSWCLYLYAMTLTHKNKPDNIFTPYHPLFLSMICVMLFDKEASNRWVGLPIIPENILKSSWYENLPEKLYDPKNVKQAVVDKNIKVLSYEKVCTDILVWMKKSGLVVNYSLQS